VRRIYMPCRLTDRILLYAHFPARVYFQYMQYTPFVGAVQY
jgi:hypothetical protein